MVFVVFCQESGKDSVFLDFGILFPSPSMRVGILEVFKYFRFLGRGKIRRHGFLEMIECKLKDVELFAVLLGKRH